jgi:surface antigen
MLSWPGAGSAAGGDDYPTAWKRPCGAVNPAGTSYVTCNCTDYAAWRISVQRDATMTDPARWSRANWPFTSLGNAKEWAGKARARGIAVDKTPALGAVAYRLSGTWGHVAIVIGIDPEARTVTLGEYNHATRHAYGTRTVKFPGPDVDGFIHAADLQVAAPEPEDS